MIRCIRAYGLNFSLPFPCPEAPFADDGAVPDVLVEDGRVPSQLSEGVLRGDGFEAAPGRFLLRAGRRAGRFLVEDGTRITLQRGGASEDPIVAFHFLHTVMAALLHQRGNVVLHAGAVAGEEGATVISGESGAGKSTVLADLAARGFPLLSDDVTALSVGPDGETEVIPGPSSVHLCGDAAERLSERLSPEVAGLPRRSWHRMKVAVPVTGIRPGGRYPFRRWVELAIGTGDEVRVECLSGARKLEALQRCIYMPMQIAEHAQRFGLLRAVMGRVPVLAIERPSGQWTLDRVAQAVLHG
jgi:hypothetical protein